MDRWQCNPDEDNNKAGLCYPKCRPGYHKVGLNLCEPDGGVGIKTTLMDRWQCNPDEDNNKAGLCYPKCRPGYSKIGLNLCQPDGGAGIRTTLMDRWQCNPDEDNNRAGLCYPKCRPGYHKAYSPLLCATDGPTSYDRGVGTTPRTYAKKRAVGFSTQDN